MTATMKGLLKGLRYISQIFDATEEDEPEMEIGNPTDVKHVAHIGWDGPAVSSPSWINDFKPNESASAPLNYTQGSKEKENPITRRHSEDVFGLDARQPAKEDADDQKHSRRRHSAGSAINSSEQDSKPRRHHRHASIEADSSPNAPSVPKKTRKKKPKDNDGSSKSGSSTSKIRKARKNLDPNLDAKPKNSEIDCPSSALQALGLDEKKDFEGGGGKDVNW